MPLDAPALAALAAAGIVIGLLGGLLGVGGGIVAVPVLLELSGGLPAALRTPVAIGTAHAAVLLSAVPAVLAMARAGWIDRKLVRDWTPWLLAGAAAGLAIGPALPDALTLGLFALVTVGLGLRMLLGDVLSLAEALPAAPWHGAPPFAVGLLAAALGVGAGTLSTPVLALFAFPLRRAIGAGALFNILVAAPAMLVFALAGLGAASRPALSLGYVALVPALLLALPALVVAPAAARLAARLNVDLLRRVFALCLFAIAARVAWKLVV